MCSSVHCADLPAAHIFPVRFPAQLSGHSGILAFWHSGILAFWHSGVMPTDKAAPQSQPAIDHNSRRLESPLPAPRPPTALGCAPHWRVRFVMCGGLLGYCRSEFGVNRECSESELCQRERYFYSLGVVNVPRIKDSSIAHDSVFMFFQVYV